jgi:tight adherence protein C
MTFLQRLLASAAVTTPRRVREETKLELSQAGIDISPDVFLGVRAVLLIAVPLLTGMWVLSAQQRGVMHWVLLGLAVLLAPRLPKMWLRRRIRANQQAIDRALPYALDLMVACVEGGLSLEAALGKVSEQSDTLLSEQIRRTLQEMTLGRPSSEALRDLGERSGSGDLKRLTESVIQAERMGIGVAQTLRTLAEDSRIKRRQRAEETARKAPAKMIPVVIMFILPSMMGVVMGPPMISLMHIFSQFHK